MTYEKYMEKCLVLQYHSMCYYLLDAPELPDAEWDRLFDEIKDYEDSRSHFLLFTYSPTQHPDSLKGERLSHAMRCLLTITKNKKKFDHYARRILAAKVLK